MSTTIKALAAAAPKAPLQPFEYNPGPLPAEHVDIAVTHCGICHSDVSMWENEWGMTTYPFVPGHEVVGRIVAVGDNVKRVKVGDTVGLGWMSSSCMHCPQCLAGDHNMCSTVGQTIVGRHGGFATHVRAHWVWAIPLPAGLDPAKAGPMFCGGLTVFNPIVQLNIKPTDHVGVVGIGGLGHLALKFLNAWGCEVTAFTSSDSKRDEAKQLGAHNVVNSRDSAQLQKIAGSLNTIISTVNVTMDWGALVGALAPKGHLHCVGAVTEPISLSVFPLIFGTKTLSGSPVGSPSTTDAMLDFAARHGIEPTTEFFPMSKANDAFEHLKSGKARYRIVLQNDL
jgi:alcohol/geraniol dehydrogenase (NADP+)